RIGLAAAERDGDRAAITRMWTTGGLALRMIGRFEEATTWYTQARRLAEEDGDTRMVGQAESGLGGIAKAQGLLDLALEHYQHALELRLSVRYHRGVSLIQEHLGEIETLRGNFPIAVEYLRQARAGLVEVGDSLNA